MCGLKEGDQKDGKSENEEKHIEMPSVREDEEKEGKNGPIEQARLSTKTKREGRRKIRESGGKKEYPRRPSLNVAFFQMNREKPKGDATRKKKEKGQSF